MVNGGERPQLHKSWPDRLCKLLESAWHADHTERPTAAQLVTELVAIKAELPAKYRRQRPMVTAPNPAGDGGGASSTNRRHSWTPQASSSLFDTGGRTRPLSGAPHNRGTTTKPQLQPTKSLPLRATSSSSCFASEKPRRWSISSAKRSSWLGKSMPSVVEGEGGRGGGARRPEPVAGSRTGRRRRRRRSSSSTSSASAAETVAEENDNNNHQARRRGSGRAEQAGEAPGTTTTGDDSCRRQPLNRRRNSRQREIIVDALAREGTAGEEAPRAGKQRTSNGEGGQTTGQRRWIEGDVGEDGTKHSGKAEQGDTIAGYDSTGATAAASPQKKPIPPRGSDSHVSSRPQRGLPVEDPETSARARRMPAQRPAAATRTTPVGTQHARDTQPNEQKTADRGVATIGAKGEEGGGGTREKHEEGGGGLLLPSRRTSLSDTAVKEEETEEDDEDASGRSRGVHRNSSLDKLWPTLQVGGDAKDVPQQASFRAGGVRVAPEPKGNKSAPAAVRAGGVTSEKEVDIFAMLGTPSGVHNTEAIEERLALLRGTIAMPRIIS